MNVQDGSELAGSTKFKFRAADDPRFTDRRMQALLRKLNDLFSEISVSEVVQIRKYISISSFYSSNHSKVKIARAIIAE